MCVNMLFLRDEYNSIAMLTLFILRREALDNRVRLDDRLLNGGRMLLELLTRCNRGRSAVADDGLDRSTERDLLTCPWSPRMLARHAKLTIRNLYHVLRLPFTGSAAAGARVRVRGLCPL